MELPSIQIQAVTGNCSEAQIQTFILSVANMVQVSSGKTPLGTITLLVGNNKNQPIFSSGQEKELQSQCGSSLTLQFLPLGPDICYANGHNIMAQRSKAEFLLLCSPDGLPSPNLLHHLLAPFANKEGTVGITEARQSPFEDTKPWNKDTGETPHYSSDCILLPSALYQTIGGFDSDAFPHFGCNLDFSWRVRSAGKTIQYQPSAIVMGAQSYQQIPFLYKGEEQSCFYYYAKLLLAFKWGFAPLLERSLEEFSAAGTNTPQQKALQLFLQHKQQGRLAVPIKTEPFIPELPSYLL